MTTRYVDPNILFHHEPRYTFDKHAAVTQYQQSWPTEPIRVEKFNVKAVEQEDGRMVSMPEGPYYSTQSGPVLRRVKIEHIEPRRRDRGFQGVGFQIDGGQTDQGSVFQVKDDHSVEWVTYKTPANNYDDERPFTRFPDRSKLGLLRSEQAARRRLLRQRQFRFGRI